MQQVVGRPATLTRGPRSRVEVKPRGTSQSVAGANMRNDLPLHGDVSRGRPPVGVGRGRSRARPLPCRRRLCACATAMVVEALVE